MALRNVAAANLQKEIEQSLATKFPGALSPRMRAESEKVLLGIPALDQMLQGGLPLGGMCEFMGPASSGRSTIATSLLARVTATAGAAAWIDVADTFCPTSAAQSGVDLQRLLWVRCKQQASPPVLQTVQPAIVREHVSKEQQVPKGGGSPHPRSETDGMPDAIAAIFAKYPSASAIPNRRSTCAIGTPSAPNRPLVPFPAASPFREEQVGTDRVASRREQEFKRAEQRTHLKSQTAKRIRTCAAPTTKANSMSLCSTSGLTAKSSKAELWSSLEKALRTTDLLLQAGGFSLLVLDLGSVSPEMALRIPLSTWFRFRAACDRTRTTLVLLTQHTCAKSSASLLVRLQPGGMQIHGRVLVGLTFAAELERERKPNQNAHNLIPFHTPTQSVKSTAWQTQAGWTAPA